MQVLSVRQPWAWAIARGHKAIENRTWDTTYRGELAIHSSLRVSADSLGHPLVRAAGWDPADPLAAAGGIIAVVTLAGMCGAAKAAEPCSCGEWAEPKSFHWQLSDVRALPQPLMTHGQPGLWTPGPELAVALAAALNGQPVPAGRS
jgi:ASCH domain